MSFFFLILCFGIAGSQENDNEFTATKKVNPFRYENIKGSPYIFEDWQKGTIYDNNLRIYPNVMLNYNGESQEIEVKTDDSFIVLESSKYLRVDIPQGEPDAMGNVDKIILQRGLHPREPDSFVRMVYSGRRAFLFVDFRCPLEKKAVRDAGQKIDFRKFDPKQTYFLKLNEKVSALKQNNSNVIKLLGHKSELESFISENNIKIESEKGLCRILEWYEQQGFIK